MSDKTTEEMEAELVDAGYDVIIDDNGDLEIEYIVDGISVDWTLDRDVGNDAMMRHVYSYMQDKRKLEALQLALNSLVVSHIWKNAFEAEICLFCCKYQERHETHETDCAWVALQEFDITAPESKSE